MAGKKNKYAFIDLFAGCGGLSQGFIKAGFDCVSAVEIDEEISISLQKNHRSTKVFQEDIKNINSNDLLNNKKEIDLVIGGPPCQGFSMAGKRIRDNGQFLDDPRNQLFREFCRIVSDLKPKVFLMENVPGILSINDGQTKLTILRIFSELGYRTSVKVLKAEEYGVPQYRRRAIFIGTKLQIDSEKFYPKITHGPELEKFITIEDAIFDLPFIESGEGQFEMQYDKKAKTDYQINRRSKNINLFNHISTNHDKRIIDILKLVKEGKGLKDLEKKYQTKSVHSGAYGRMDRKRPAYTITTRFDTPPVGRVTHPKLNRSITPREAARIQSFDDDFIFMEIKVLLVFR